MSEPIAVVNLRFVNQVLAIERLRNIARLLDLVAVDAQELRDLDARFVPEAQSILDATSASIEACATLIQVCSAGIDLDSDDALAAFAKLVEDIKGGTPGV